MMTHAAQLAVIKQLNRQESDGSAGNCQAYEQAGITQHRSSNFVIFYLASSNPFSLGVNYFKNFLFILLLLHKMTHS